MIPLEDGVRLELTLPHGRLYAIAGMDALLRELTEITGGSAPTR